jgi:hypothetical protein
MENQEQTIHGGVSFRVAIIVSIVVLVAAFLISGSFVYFVQGASFSAREVALEREIDSLQGKIADLENEGSSGDVPGGSSDVEDLDLPVVVYGRPGLLNNTEEGRAEKEVLEQKLVQPYIDYYNENGVELVALYVTVPAKVGDEYLVLGIFGGEGHYGTEEFLFGVREGEYDYWEPMCMGECEYSDAFRTKYPEIVN